jgi:hypothetical protein
MRQYLFKAGLTEESNPLVVSKTSNSSDPTRLQFPALIADFFAVKLVTSQYWQSYE